MSQNTSDRKHRSSCFPGCFGFSVKDDEEKKLSAGGGGGSGKEIYGGKRISGCWSFRRRKKSSAKTVPVNNSKFLTKLRSMKEIQVVNKDMNLHGTGSDQILAGGGGGGGSGNNLNKVMAAEPDQGGLHRSSQVMSHNNGEHIILEKTKSLEGEKGTTTRHTSSRSTRKQLTKSVSAEPGIDPNEDDAKFGSLVGISILMVILGIVLIWGKICAIFCTSICFYIRAQQRNEYIRAQQRNESNKKKGAPKEQLDGSNEKEHNRKVVLQGLVERSKRHT